MLLFSFIIFAKKGKKRVLDLFLLNWETLLAKSVSKIFSISSSDRFYCLFFSARTESPPEEKWGVNKGREVVGCKQMARLV
jgi:hypothetical protein